MFHNEFYPTPKEVSERMLFNHEITDKIILEPQAGAGDLVDVIRTYRPKEIIICEITPKLSAISKPKADRFLSDDFLKVTGEQISHVDFIIMNPPFSNAIEHINHAFEIAPDGCTIISLLNYSNYRNMYSRDRRNFEELIENYGFIENLGNVFSTSERKTDVETGLVNLFKPASEGDFEFEGFFDMEEEKENTVAGIMPHNEITELVNRYVGAVKMFNEVEEANNKIKSLVSPISEYAFSFGCFERRSNSMSEISRDQFKKELQKEAWKNVFSNLKMDKYVTRSVREDLNRFVEMQQNVPFTVKNIYKMVELIACTHKQRMERVVVESFESICSFAASNNTAGEGWKTNSGYKVNKKFIHPYICRYDPKWPKSHVHLGYSSGASIFDDILKALCYISGRNYDLLINLDRLFWDNKVEWGKWFEWNDIFRVKGFKKGTMHFEFTDTKLWEQFNKEYARIKGWQLPKETDKKQKGTERTKSKKVATL